MLSGKKCDTAEVRFATEDLAEQHFPQPSLESVNFSQCQHFFETVHRQDKEGKIQLDLPGIANNGPRLPGTTQPSR